MKFVIATGGTGGHLFPALKTAQELKRDGHEIVFLGSFRQGQGQIQKSGFAFEELGTRGLVAGQTFSAVLAMTRGVVRSFRRLRQLKPDAVLGFGGYGAFPVLLSAALLRYPTLIHEQNVVPGRANAILAKFVKRVAISFIASTRYFKSKKTVLTGCPCHLPPPRADRAVILRRFGLVEGKTTILVFGGSQGSHVINDGFMAAAQSLKEKLGFQVIHICGKTDYTKLENEYNQLGIPFALFEFLDKMEEAYHIADLVVSRSGAATITEMALFQLPAVLIPYPHAKGHQKENALILCEAGVAQLIEDKDLSVSRLNEAILKILDLKGVNGKFNGMAMADAAQRLARAALEITQ